jgi:hypothetical protein
MQNATDSGVSALPEHHAESIGSIACELSTLLDRIQASIEMLETAMVRDGFPGKPEHVGDVVVLDDVAPRYAKAGEALIDCKRSLDAALKFLHDTGRSGPLTKSAPKLLPLSTRR